MRYPLTLAIALAITACPLLAQQDSEDARWLDHCRDHGSWDHGRARFCDVRVERVPLPSGLLDVDARENGGVDVVGGSGNGLVVHEWVETEGWSDAEAQQIASQVRVKIGNTIRADGPPEEGHRHWTVSYRIEAPRKIDLSAESTNGPLSATSVVGRVDLRTENGPISLDDCGGTVHARTENGPLEVNLSGARWDGSGLDAETENGPVELNMPSNYAAHLETGTVNGPMSIGFPITVEGRLDVKRLSLDINGGGPTVRAVTTNGPVTVDRH